MRKRCQAKFPPDYIRLYKGKKMRSFGQFLGAPLIASLVLAHGCAMVSEGTPKKGPPVGLIATPPSYYSTLKAKYLGQKYQENVARLVEKIVRNPKTSNLQFANKLRKSK